jgi:hypothetical protein
MSHTSRLDMNKVKRQIRRLVVNRFLLVEDDGSAAMPLSWGLEGLIQLWLSTSKPSADTGWSMPN